VEHGGVFQGMLARLPNLKQLSLKLGPVYGTLPEDYFSLPTTNHGVTRAALPFPKLETLKLRHLNMTEWEFVGLARSQNLQQLVVLDALPGPSPALLSLIHKLQVQTNYRAQVVHSLALKDPAACYCSQY
ncbi:hypothetical protein AAFF_G00131380, partial [Aldrovandia affinis]